MSRDYVLRPFHSEVELRIDYEKELNPQQYAAVTAEAGPSLVIAGAGAGKTRTLTYRVAYLLEKGIPPHRILLLTFTNKAAKEMMRRVTDLLGGDVSSLWGGTFHAVGYRVLRRHADRMGYKPDFTIMDREDAKDLIRTCLDKSDIDIKATRFPKPEVLADIYSLAANTEKSVEEVLKQQYDYFLGLAPEITSLREQYTQRKRACQLMDFDDLLLLWLKLLQTHTDICEEYQRRFQFVLVDEYQDTNRLQSDLIDLLAARHQQVAVVGDDSQSIYSWRGANFQNILRFPERYPGAKVYKIETNYRSTPEILQLANAAIAKNVNQFAKELTPARPSGSKPVLAVCGDGGEQASFVAQRVLELRDEGIPLEEMAVLYRAHFHAMELQLELTRRNIPFSITSGIRFFEQAHIKDVTAYLKLLVNRQDELAFKRMVRLLPGIGSRTADKLWLAFEERNRGTTAPLAEVVQGCAKKVPAKAKVGWAQLVATLAQLSDSQLEGQTGARLRLIVEAGYDEYLKATYTNYRSRQEDLQQLAIFAEPFNSMEEFLSQLALLTNVETERQVSAPRDDEELRLSTIHQAKGLEFRVVFVIMLCEGLFPSSRSLETTDGEEEERRLFYVAVTRAKDELYLSYPLMRWSYGRAESQMQQASRFLSEIPDDLREEWNLDPSSSFL